MYRHFIKPLCDLFIAFLLLIILSPIILLTAKAQQHDKLAGYKHGADDYIAKPFNEEELKLKVHNIVFWLIKRN